MPAEGRIGAGVFDPTAAGRVGRGTIRAVHETSIGSKLLARVVEVNLKAGQKVKAGDVLVRLDDTDLRAKLQQAKAVRDRPRPSASRRLPMRNERPIW